MRLLDWTPVYLVTNVPFLKFYELPSGLKIFHPSKKYALPAKLRVRAPLDEITSNSVYIATLKLVKTARPLTKYMLAPDEILDVTLLPPRLRSTVPRYRLYIVGLHEVHGLSRFVLHRVESSYATVLYETASTSRSGKLLYKILVALTPPGKKLEITEVRGEERGKVVKEVLVFG